MEIFYTEDIEGNVCRLDADESAHCIRVLRHRCGDAISVIDGRGNLMKCRIVSDSPKGAEAEIMETLPDWGGHPYRLHLAVCPTKNNDRYEWFAEKACEIGADTIIPIIGEHSERKVFKTARIEKILVSAAKQSLKGAVPAVLGPMTVRDFIMEYGDIPDNTGKISGDTGETHSGNICRPVKPDGMQSGHTGTSNVIRPFEGNGALRLIAYCFEDGSRPRISIKKALEALSCNSKPGNPDTACFPAPQAGTFIPDKPGTSSGKILQDICIMIGPEGDFSREEAALAISYGFIPVHLGASRLRTETAAVTAAEAVYFHYME